MKSTSRRCRTLAMMVCCWGIVLGTIQPAHAILTVTNLNDSGPGSLRQAIADAPPGETIDFGVIGTITLTSGQMVIDKNLTISGPGATNLTVSGNKAWRVLLVTNGTVAINSLTITNGRLTSWYDYGAGIYNSSVLTVSNCIISECGEETWRNSGGGIYNSGTLALIDSTLSQNSGGGYGGGINNQGSLVASNSVILDNYTTGNGGGIYGGGAFINCIVCRNWAGEVGGGIWGGGIPYQLHGLLQQHRGPWWRHLWNSNPQKHHRGR